MMQRLMVALNQNAVNPLFGSKNESYFIGKSSHLLYTKPKEYVRTLPQGVSIRSYFSQLFQEWCLAYRRFYVYISDSVSYETLTP